MATGLIVKTSTTYGDYLARADGFTLYMFAKDTQYQPSTCHGNCAENWPHLGSKDAPTAGPGVNPSQLSTVADPNAGVPQVTYNGWPMYLFAEEETEPGQIHGAEDDHFHLLAPSGAPTIPASVIVMKSATYGEYLAAADGFTLYMFGKDTQGSPGTCLGHCAGNWPHLSNRKDRTPPKGGPGVNPNQLSQVDDPSIGVPQITYNGWPLYLFTEEDSQPGQINGAEDHDFHLIDPSGAPIIPASRSTVT